MSLYLILDVQILDVQIVRSDGLKSIYLVSYLFLFFYQIHTDNDDSRFYNNSLVSNGIAQ